MKTKTKKKAEVGRRRAAPKALTEGMSVGQWRIARFGKKNKLWMFCWTGEAMVVPEARLEAALTRFWKREF